jgi:hypothetical protein
VSDTAKIVFKAAFFVSTALGLSLSIGSLPAQAAGCEDLIDLKIPATTIRIAQSIPAGDYTASDKLKYANMPRILQGTCLRETGAGFRYRDRDVAA